jgi:hypothetical protein
VLRSSGNDGGRPEARQISVTWKKNQIISQMMMMMIIMSREQ